MKILIMLVWDLIRMQLRKAPSLVSVSVVGKSKCCFTVVRDLKDCCLEFHANCFIAKKWTYLAWEVSWGRHKGTSSQYTESCSKRIHGKTGHQHDGYKWLVYMTILSPKCKSRVIAYSTKVIILWFVLLIRPSRSESYWARSAMS